MHGLTHSPTFGPLSGDDTVLGPRHTFTVDRRESKKLHFFAIVNSSKHSRTALGKTVCVSCFRQWVLAGTEQGQEALAEQSERKRRRAYESSWESGSVYAYDDPYLYMDTHYPNYEPYDFSSKKEEQ